MKFIEILKNEMGKSRQSLKRILLVTILAVGVYLYLAYSGNFQGFTGKNYSFLLQDRGRIEALKKQQKGVVDEEFIQKAEQAYRDYVDRFRSSDDEIRKELREYNEPVEVEDILYDKEYCGFVFRDKTLEEHPEIEILLGETGEFIRYAKDPEKIVEKYGRVRNYSKELQEDYWKCIRKYQRGKRVVAGYFLGWDMAISIMQHLPPLLGIVIVVSLFGLFAKERRYQAQPLLLTLKYGKRELLSAKLLLAWGLTTLQWGLFQLAGIGISAVLLGLEGKECTFFDSLNPSVYGFSCIQYYLLQMLVSYLGTIFFMLFICLLSSLLNDRLALTFGVIITFATSFVNDTYRNIMPAFTRMEKLMAMTPTQLMGAYNTFQIYQGCSVGDVVLRLPVMSGIALAVGITVCLSAVVWRGRRV